MFQDNPKARSLEKALSTGQGGFSSAEIELLALARSLQHLPLASTPAGVRQRRYLHAALTKPVARGNTLLRLSGYFGGAVLAFGIVLTLVLASGSIPGSPLYGLKSNGQRLRVNFATDETSKANLQLQFAEQRLTETAQLLGSDAAPETKNAAITELTAQNLATVETVKRVAVAQKNTELLNRLSAITTSQTTVLSNTKDPKVQDVAKNALAATEAGSKVIAEAKQLVAAANDSTIADLPTTFSGVITKVTDTEIVVNKTAIAIGTQTEVIDSKNTAATPTLKINLQVTVTASQKDKIYTAQKIVVDGEITAKVKGAASDQASVKTEIRTTPELDQTEATKVQSGFIIETPEPQFPTN